MKYKKGLLEKEISVLDNNEVMVAYNVMDTSDVIWIQVP